MFKLMAFSIVTKEISTAGWIALALILVFIFILNFSLWSALKRKGPSEFQVLHRLGDAIRDPNKKENDMLDELSERVGRLKDGENNIKGKNSGK